MPLSSRATAWWAAAQSRKPIQAASFNQMIRVTVSVTVPFPQFTYRLKLSKHGGSALVESPPDPPGLPGLPPGACGTRCANETEASEKTNTHETTTAVMRNIDIFFPPR